MKYILSTLALFTFSLVSGHAETPFTQLFYTDEDPSVKNPAGLTEFHSTDGVLEIDMTAGYDQTDPDHTTFPLYPYTGKSTDDPFARLAYSCKYTNSTDAPVVSYPGPFLRVFPGDRIIIHFTNALHTQRTNLHFHGLAVSPRQGTTDGLDFGDYVGKPYVNAISPGTERTYNFLVPVEQRPGLYWYHAHAHGVAEDQVGCGLGGALYIEGIVPDFLASWCAKVKSLAEPAVADKLIASVSAALPKLQQQVMVLKDYVTPGVFPYYGPFEQTVNGKITFSIPTKAVPNPVESPYWIDSDGSKQIWSFANESADLYYLLKFKTDTGDQPFEVISRDGGPDNFSGPQMGSPETTVMIGPGSRVTLIAPTDKLNGKEAHVVAEPVTTALGAPESVAIPPQFADYYFEHTTNPKSPVKPVRLTPWRIITVHPSTKVATAPPMPSVLTFPVTKQPDTETEEPPVDNCYVFFEPGFIEPSPDTLPQEATRNLTLYKYVSPSYQAKGTKNPWDAYDPYEPAIATLVPGVPQRWIIQNATTEWHSFHIHQIQFKVDYFTTINMPYDQQADPRLNTDRPEHNYRHPFYSDDLPPPPGLQNGDPLYSGLQDTVPIPPFTQVWITLPMTEGTHDDDPIEGQFVMHCHILGHEDGGMMANVDALLAGETATDVKKALQNAPSPHGLPPREIATVLTDRPLKLADATGHTQGVQVFTKSDYTLVTFGFTHCDGSCPLTVAKCLEALAKLPGEEKNRIAPCFISLDPNRDHGPELTSYAKEQAMPKSWKVLVDTDLSGIRAFGVRREIRHDSKGAAQIWHTSVVYVVDRNLHIRAAFDADDTSKTMADGLDKLLSSKSEAPDNKSVATPPPSKVMTGVEMTMRN